MGKIGNDVTHEPQGMTPLGKRAFNDEVLGLALGKPSRRRTWLSRRERLSLNRKFEVGLSRLSKFFANAKGCSR